MNKRFRLGWIKPNPALPFLLILISVSLAFSAPPPDADPQAYVKLTINSAKYIDKDAFRCILADITVENATHLNISGGRAGFKLKDMENGYAYNPGTSLSLPAELKYDLWSVGRIEPHTKGRGVVCFELPKNRHGKLRLYFNGKVTDSLNKFINITNISHSINPVDYNEAAKPQPQKPQPVEDASLSSDKAKVTKKDKDVITVSEKEDVTVINIKGPKVPVDDEKEAIERLSDILAPEKADKNLQRAEALEKRVNKLESDLNQKRDAQRERQAEIQQISTRDFEVTDLAVEKISDHRYKVSGFVKNNTDFYFDYVKFKSFLKSGLSDILKEGSFTCAPFAPGEKKHFEDDVKYDGLMLVEKCDVELNYFMIQK